MDNFIKSLKESKYLEPETPLAVKNTIIAQKELTKQGLVMLPTAFIEFLYHCNGVSAQDSCILGIPPVNNNKLDIIEFNKDYNRSDDMVILGYDDFAFLVYNTTSKTYQLVDKESQMVLEEFQDNELKYAVMSVLHVSYE